MGFSSVKKGNFGGPRTPTEFLTFQVMGYHFVDSAAAPGKVKPHADDYIEGGLLRDAFGLTAQFDENGLPLTMVKIKLRQPKEGDTSFDKRPPLADFRDGKGLGDAMGIKAIGSAENCYLDQKTGFVVSRWVKRVFADFAEKEDQQWPITAAWASIVPEWTNKDDPSKKGQNRYIALADYAQRFDGADATTAIADLRTKAIAAIAQLNENDFPGVHGFKIRGVDERSDDFDRGDIDVFVRWDTEAGAYASAEATVDAFLASDEGTKWAGIIGEYAGVKGTLMEVIPMSKLGTGSASLPSSRLDYARQKQQSVANEARFDDSVMYRYIVKNDEGGVAKRYGFAMSDIYAMRGKDENGYGKWYSVGGRPIVNNGPIFATDEVITENLSEAAKANFVASAKRRAEAEPAPTQEAEPEAAPAANYGM